MYKYIYIYICIYIYIYYKETKSLAVEHNCSVVPHF